MPSHEVNICALDPYLGIVSKHALSALEFPQQLAALRKQHGLTQHALAERIGIHVVQLRRYEAGSSLPTLDVIRKLATALNVSADLLLFGKDERGPDDELRLQFEAVTRFDPEEKHGAHLFRIVCCLSGFQLRRLTFPRVRLRHL